MPPLATLLGMKLLLTASGESTDLTARLAITMPAPESRSPPAASISSADPRSAVLIWVLVNPVFADLMSPAMAAACGAAAEVPQNGSKPPTNECVQSAAVRSTLASVVPPLVPNKTFPGVIAAPAGV